MVEVNIFINFIVCTYLDMTSILFLTCFCSENFSGNLFYIRYYFSLQQQFECYNRNVLNTNILQFK